MSLPVSRPAGWALLIGSQGCRVEPLDVLHRLGFQCAELEDPYAAMAELHRRPLVYWALVLSLNSFYREELQLISAVKRRWPHVEIWLTHADGRAAAMAEAMRLGADGLLLEDGFHRSAIASQDGAAALRGNLPQLSPAAPAPQRPPVQPAPPEPVQAPAAEEYHDEYADMDAATGEPILSAEELRALLADPPVMPPSPVAEL